MVQNTFTQDKGRKEGSDMEKRGREAEDTACWQSPLSLLVTSSEKFRCLWCATECCSVTCDHQGRSQRTLLWGHTVSNSRGMTSWQSSSQAQPVVQSVPLTLTVRILSTRAGVKTQGSFAVPTPLACPWPCSEASAS